MKKFNPLTFVCLIIFISFSFPSAAQQKTANSLLWRISGNGLTAPSYLFGTIHLNDERVFNFGDSLYHAISSTEGFAMELNPQQLTLFVIDQIKQEIANSKKISEILSESDYKKYGPLLAKKLAKKQADITTEDIMKEKNKWIREKFKTGKMQTFVDAYLYDIARRQGKWTGGVEDLQDQLSLMNDVIDKSDIAELVAPDRDKSDYVLGTMINAYQNSDLDAISAISNSQDSLANDKIIIKRNVRMAARMDSMTRIRTMVFAVGCAHLPGKMGVIELLRKRGFQVDPVVSSKKIKPGEYVVNEKPIEWEINKDDGGFYQVSMPGKAEELKLYGIITMKVNIDFSKNSGYFTSAVISPYSATKLDSALDQLSLQVFPRSGSRTVKNITVSGVQGKIYELEDDEGVRKGYILHKDSRIFIALGILSKLSKDGMTDIDRFLKSFQVLNPAPSQTASNFHYVDSLEGYELEVPSKPELLKEFSGKKMNEGVKTSLYSSFDPNSGTAYVFGTNSLLPGSFIQNDSVYLSAVIKNAKDRIGSVIIDTTFYENDVRVHEVSGLVKQNPLLMIHSRYYIRGDRWYVLVTTFGADKPDNLSKSFFDSFHFRDFPPVNWKMQTSSDSLISAWCPTALTASPGEKDGAADVLYDATDTINAHIHSIVAWHLADYYWSKSDSAFWLSRISAKIGKDDSLIYKKPVTNGDISGWEFEKSSKHSVLRQRFRILRYGDEIYTAMAVKPASEINDENTNRFFESIRFKKPAKPTHLLNSHAGLLLSKLFSKDSATVANAMDFLATAPITVSDLDTLHHTVVRIATHELDNPLTDKWYDLIFSHIKSIHDSSSFNFARDKYRSAPDSNAQLKIILLEIMTSFPSVENFNVVADLLNSSVPKTDFSRILRNNFKDTCRLTASIIPKLLPLLKNDFACLSIMDICNTLIDSNLLDRKLLSPYIPDCIRFSKSRVSSLMSDAENYYTLDRSMIEFLGKLKDQAANNQLKQYFPVNDNYIKYKTMQELTKNGVQVDPSIYLTLAADKYYRIYFYNFLKGQNKLNLFPATYKTQKMFAESNIWEDVSEDNDPKSIAFLMQKQIMYKGKLSNFYFFKVGFDRDKPTVTYLGCNGPYDLKSVDPEEAESGTHMYYDDDFDAKKMQQQVNALLKKYTEQN